VSGTTVFLGAHHPCGLDALLSLGSRQGHGHDDAFHHSQYRLGEQFQEDLMRVNYEDVAYLGMKETNVGSGA